MRAISKFTRSHLKAQSVGSRRISYAQSSKARVVRTMRSRTRVAIIGRRKLRVISIEVVDMATASRY